MYSEVKLVKQDIGDNILYLQIALVYIFIGSGWRRHLHALMIPHDVVHAFTYLQSSKFFLMEKEFSGLR